MAKTKKKKKTSPPPSLDPPRPPPPRYVARSTVTSASGKLLEKCLLSTRSENRSGRTSCSCPPVRKPVLQGLNPVASLPIVSSDLSLKTVPENNLISSGTVLCSETVAASQGHVLASPSMVVDMKASPLAAPSTSLPVSSEQIESVSQKSSDKEISPPKKKWTSL